MSTGGNDHGGEGDPEHDGQRRHLQPVTDDQEMLSGTEDEVMPELATIARRWRNAEERLHEAIWDRYQQGWRVHRIARQAGVSRYYVEQSIKARQHAAAEALETSNHDHEHDQDED